jgi:hypothetical protein
VGRLSRVWNIECWNAGMLECWNAAGKAWLVANPGIPSEASGANLRPCGMGIGVHPAACQWCANGPLPAFCGANSGEQLASAIAFAVLLLSCRAAKGKVGGALVERWR